MNVLDLFSGIGGFSLGLERAGMRTVAFCEIDPYCRAVLRKHWPDVPIFEDVRKLTGSDVPGVDVICGGFPCQDISFAGKGAGIKGERSGLWREYARLIGEIRPSYVIVENVAALLGRGLSTVLGDLSEIGYDAEWHCIPASYVGAPHRRDRVWIVAYSDERIWEQVSRPQRPQGGRKANASCNGASSLVADPASERCGEAREHSERHQEWTACCCEVLADPNSERLQNGRQAGVTPGPRESIVAMALSEFERHSVAWWAVEPDVGRVAHGVPARVDRLRALGNAVVPQIPEIIGRAIMSAA